MVMQDDSGGIDTHSSARPVDLSIVLSIEVDDLVQVSTMTICRVRGYTHIDLSAAVVLDNLVRSVVSTSTNDPCHVARFVLFLIYSQPVPVFGFHESLTIKIASSQTSSNQTNSMLQPSPRQYTPSPAVLPIITFRSVAPFSRTNAVSFSPTRWSAS